MDGPSAARVAEEAAGVSERVRRQRSAYTAGMVIGGDSELRIHEPLCAVFRRRLKAAGQKYTTERAQILDAIIKLDDVFDADTLQESLRESGFRVSKATVYRTLKLMQESGIIQQVLLDAEQSRWQLIYGRTPRDLLIRVDTNEVVPIDAPELTALCERICAERGLALHGRRFQIFAARA